MSLRNMNVMSAVAENMERSKIYDFSARGPEDRIEVKRAIKEIATDITAYTDDYEVFAVAFVADECHVLCLEGDALTQDNVQQFLNSLKIDADVVCGTKPLMAYTAKYGEDIREGELYIYSSKDCAEVATIKNGNFCQFCVSSREFPSLVALLKAINLG